MKHHHNALVTRKVCGRCGVYRHLHPVDWCSGFRTSWWWDRHFTLRHIAVLAWVHLLSSGARQTICDRLAKRGRDWCQLVDSFVYADQWDDRRDDYSDGACLCDFPWPLAVGAPPARGCYCTPPTEERAA